ncbi:MAG TPA: glycoside hydrolase family 6 protein [Candidatus Limnocylindrales bacterium]
MPGSERSRAAVLGATAMVIAVAVIAVVAAGSGGGARVVPRTSGPPAASPDAAATAALDGTLATGLPLMTPPPALYVPHPDPEAIAQLDELRRAGRSTDAGLLRAMLDTPSAVWFQGGSPAEVERDVRELLARTGETVPVLVVYNVPGRDCAQFSAGGALDAEAYRAWIEAFADGIADSRALVILEPDGLALQPADCAQPDTFDRTALIAGAVDTIRAAAPNVGLYLDAGHSAWHPAPEMARRLVRAGVRRATGFFLNVSNYRPTAELVAYGTEISSCIARADPSGACGDDAVAAGAPNAGLSPFVIDTSRNGQGPWTPTAVYPDAQDWCNPPSRGLGARPTLDTAIPLVDAFLWIKIPGESDGTCTRGGAAGSPDPEWARVDPAAGRWFPEQALQLAQLANPPLVP